MSELNPDHPVTVEMHDQWHKIVALLMLKFKMHHIEITEEDVKLFETNDVGAVTISEKGKSIHLDLISWEKARRMAYSEGGVEFEGQQRRPNAE